MDEDIITPSNAGGNTQNIADYQGRSKWSMMLESAMAHGTALAAGAAAIGSIFIVLASRKIGKIAKELPKFLDKSVDQHMNALPWIRGAYNGRAGSVAEFAEAEVKEALRLIKTVQYNSVNEFGKAITHLKGELKNEKVARHIERIGKNIAEFSVTDHTAIPNAIKMFEAVGSFESTLKATAFTTAGAAAAGTAYGAYMGAHEADSNRERYGRIIEHEKTQDTKIGYLEKALKKRSTSDAPEVTSVSTLGL